MNSRETRTKPLNQFKINKLKIVFVEVMFFQAHNPSMFPRRKIKTKNWTIEIAHFPFWNWIFFSNELKRFKRNGQRFDLFFFLRRYEIVHIAAYIQRDKYDSNWLCYGTICLWYGFVFEISRIRNYRKSTDFVIKRFLCRIYLPCISFCCKENFIELKLLRMFSIQSIHYFGFVSMYCISIQFIA